MFSHALSDVIWLDIIWALGPVAPIIMSAQILSDHFMSAQKVVIQKNVMILKKAFEDDADETSNQFDFKQ